jgi:hypothetical protein
MPVLTAGRVVQHKQNTTLAYQQPTTTTNQCTAAFADEGMRRKRAFGESRLLSDLTRNGLVSVFLRKLEYYEGILFLMINRAAQFDEAILSRIHLLMRYEDLTQVVRR